MIFPNQKLSLLYFSVAYTRYTISCIFVNIQNQYYVVVFFHCHHMKSSPSPCLSARLYKIDKYRACFLYSFSFHLPLSVQNTFIHYPWADISALFRFFSAHCTFFCCPWTDIPAFLPYSTEINGSLTRYLAQRTTHTFITIFTYEPCNVDKIIFLASSQHD